ncbi:phosphatase PAP2 family protein [Sphingobium sp. GW456-12-10-14-TSB1]|jgi:membrane-associated phospholipid phosphatase|uniref:phosphatase PAP2 family protein n=1 Tax=Sphingobium TaxID=165695 RepID=UPI000A395BC1|nr:phosphatase PAP2 family protein [Sphingobium sp. GW456-12-10-14-TSB1]OUC53578.1 phosphatase PAP2 family protein [Sphingobium sp. GW456-12-10-14-TSB1]
MKRIGLSAALALSVFASETPALANDRNGWSTASDVGAIGLGAIALGLPLAKGDETGALQAGASLGVGYGIAEGLKHVTHEQRPDGSDFKSFPSAHTSLSFAAAATLNRRYGWQVGLPATLVATFVGIARVEARRHHWYDAVAGAAIGEASGLLITKPYSSNVRLVPWGDSHGGGAVVAVRF